MYESSRPGLWHYLISQSYDSPQEEVFPKTINLLTFSFKSAAISVSDASRRAVALLPNDSRGQINRSHTGFETDPFSSRSFPLTISAISCSKESE